MSASRLLRTTATAAALILALTACGPLATESDSAESAASNDTAMPPTTPSTLSAQDLEEGSADPADSSVPAQTPVDLPIDAMPTPTTAPVAATTTPAPTAPTPTVPEHRRCDVTQGADGGEYIVSGIADDDPDGGLTARVNAGYSYEMQGLLPEGALVSTFIDRADRPSCLITRDGAIWWQFVAPSMTSGLWVNSRYLEMHNPFVPEEEPDVHSDCVYLPNFPDTCIPVYTSGGVILGADLEEGQREELSFACIDQSFVQACDVLDALEPASE